MSAEQRDTGGPLTPETGRADADGDGNGNGDGDVGSDGNGSGSGAAEGEAGRTGGGRRSGSPGGGLPAGHGSVVVGGSVTGGAVATGKDARATDSSRTSGMAAPDTLPPPVGALPPAEAGAVVVAGHVTGGALATGTGSQALFSAQRTDPAYQDLAAALELLASHLPLLVPGPERDGLGGALEEIRQDIAATGRAPHSRLRRLRDQLTTGNTALAALASAAAVAEAIGRLLS
jgi:hypothetical protein